ncbi:MULTISPECIES: MobA/MobL family protein [unclassified Phaeobacter]|uniref:MobA/MobL family protein n=1 Tax=unclassified Phaeobacter TaxID=2621772 RepID=UPI003A83C3D3
MALFSFRHSTKTFSPKVESEARKAQKGQTAAHLRYIARPKAARVVIQERLPASSFAATACVVEDAAQKRKGRVCERLVIALPVEATGTQREDLVRSFCVFMTKQKAGYVAAIHDQSGNDLRNPHAHIVLFDEYERNGERGRPRSVIGMARKHAIENAARDWAQLHNRMMQGWGYGKSSMIDHRSYAARGLERIPTIHEGPASRAVRAKGKKPNSNPAWKNIDAGQSRADANALIQEINENMEKLNDPNRLGTHNEKYRDSRKGSVQTSRARRGGLAQMLEIQRRHSSDLKSLKQAVERLEDLVTPLCSAPTASPEPNTDRVPRARLWHYLGFFAVGGGCGVFFVS